MSKLLNLFSDDYDRETLLIPSLAVIITGVIVGALLGLNVNVAFGFAIMGIELATVVIWLLASSVREQGKKLEGELFTSGMPTTVALRLSESSGFEVNARRKLLQDLTGVTLLDKQEESAKPHEADERILHAVNAAKEKMRDPKIFKLLRRELKSYGQWRNLVAIRWWGFGISILSVLVALLVMIFADHHGRTLPAVALLVGVLGSLYWLTVTRKSCVLIAAERYKDQYFKSLTLLKQ